MESVGLALSALRVPAAVALDHLAVLLEAGEHAVEVVLLDPHRRAISGIVIPGFAFTSSSVCSARVPDPRGRPRRPSRCAAALPRAVRGARPASAGPRACARSRRRAARPAGARKARECGGRGLELAVLLDERLRARAGARRSRRASSPGSHSQIIPRSLVSLPTRRRRAVKRMTGDGLSIRDACSRLHETASRAVRRKGCLNKRAATRERFGRAAARWRPAALARACTPHAEPDQQQHGDDATGDVAQDVVHGLGCRLQWGFLRGVDHRHAVMQQRVDQDLVLRWRKRDELLRAVFSVAWMSMRSPR